MNYKGYIGVVEYDEENRIFSGRVINTRDTITFVGKSVDEIEEEFKNSVEDYLSWCKEDGVEPEKPYSGKFNVRFTPQLHQQAAVKAQLLGMSLNKFVEEAVKKEIG